MPPGVVARRAASSAPSCSTNETLPVKPGEDTARQLAEGIAALGIARLPWSRAQLVRNRVNFLRKSEEKVAGPVRTTHWPNRRRLARAFLADRTALS